MACCEIEEIASCKEELECYLSSEAEPDNHLLFSLNDHLVKDGWVRSKGELFAFKKPPFLGGSFQADNITLMSITNYHNGLSKLYMQVRNLEPGTEVVAKAIK